MTNPQKSYRHIEHAFTCPAATDEQGDCDCFFSALAKTSIFQTATAQGPPGVEGYLDVYAQAQIGDFVNAKRAQFGPQLSHRASSPQLYQPLLDGETRVLELHPGESEDPLQGSLHVVSIDFAHTARAERSTKPFDDPNNQSRRTLTYTRYNNHAVSLVTGEAVWFTALSYVWGAPIFDQTISFERGSISITSSLASALQQLRLVENSVFLWIDQVSINQYKKEEKVQQIPLMGLIYTHATNTVIWLGDEDESDPLQAFDLMETVYARLQGTDAQVTSADLKRLDFPPADDRAWWSVRQLLRRPWYWRLWIIQEGVLSQNLFVKCGHAEACWDDFASWCYCLQESGLLGWLTTDTSLDQRYGKPGQTSSVPPQGALMVISIQAARVQNQTLVQKEWLLNALASTRYAQATEPKDKIYGVLGIAESNIIPNYSPTMSIRQVYHEACLTQLPRNMYEMLSCVDHETPLEPSWVPDWSVPRVTEALGYLTKAWALYCAGGRPVSGQHHKVELNADKTQVALLGKVFDSVVSLGCVSQDTTLDIDSPKVGNQTLAMYAQLVRSTTSYPIPGTSVYDAFFQTLVAGRDGSQAVLPSQEHSDVFSIILDSTTGLMPSLSGQTYTLRRQKGHFTLNSLKSRKPAKTFEDLQTATRAALNMRRFAVTAKGYFALVPRGTRDEDEIVVLDRACTPFVVRRVGGDIDGNKFEVLGEAYVHGIMAGEVMEMEDITLQDVTIV